jgi:hypothetical protein
MEAILRTLMYPSWPNVVPPDPESSGSMAATTIKQKYLFEESMPRVDLIFVDLNPKLSQKNSGSLSESQCGNDASFRIAFTSKCCIFGE